MKRWKMQPISSEQAAEFAQKQGVSPLMAQVLLSRGITSQEALQEMEDPLPALHSPYLLQDMDQAVQRIQLAIQEAQQIVVYGDYDCDGITSTAMLYHYLESSGAMVRFYIPDREGEGYGLNRDAVAYLRQQGTDLLITVDNGISSLEEIAYAKELGLDVIVTDHHMPRALLPDCVAVINPHRLDSTYPFPDLAGVGVAFKLICALEGDESCQETMEYYGDLLALGTIADVVPLQGENRALVKWGLPVLQTTQNLGLMALIQASGLGERQLTSESVAFGLAPRVNAAGRLGYAQRALELLLTEDEEEAEVLAQELNGYNQARKGMEQKIFEEIRQRLQAKPALARQRVVVLSGEGWHQGVIGIVASKVVELVGRPCVLLSVEGEQARGSCRSVEGFSIVQALTACESHLLRYGGHSQAGGLTLQTTEIPAFCQALQEYAADQFDTMPTSTLTLQGSLQAKDVTMEQVKALNRLEPFGCGNPQPIFCLPGCRIEGIYSIGEGKHLRLRLGQNGAYFYGVYFGMAASRFPYSEGDTVDLAVQFSVQVYQGQEQLSIQIVDIHPEHLSQTALWEGREVMDRLYRREPLLPHQKEQCVPDRQDLVKVYKYLRSRGGLFPGGAEQLWPHLAPLSYAKVCNSLLILQEQKLLAPSKTGTGYRLLAVEAKRDLEKSPLLSRLRQWPVV